MRSCLWYSALVQHIPAAEFAYAFASPHQRLRCAFPFCRSSQLRLILVEGFLERYHWDTDEYTNNTAPNADDPGVTAWCVYGASPSGSQS